MAANGKEEAYRRFSEWQERAEDDVKIMEVALKEGGLPNPICFHAQQAAEKYLKGFLVFRDIEFPKVHSLIDLLDRCIKVDKEFASLKEDAVFLNAFYVETRYVGDYPSFSMKDAKEAYDGAVRVRDFVLGKLKDEA